MTVFKKYLQNSESIFKNETALDSNFIPRGKIEFRENENQYIAECIRPLFQRRSGKNLIILGSPGIGKTLACTKIKEEIDETTDDILVFYINLWKKNTQHKIILELCEQLDYKFIQNKSSDELFQIIKQKINQKSAVFILDEVDKIDSTEILYPLVEDIYRKTILMITNDKQFTYKLDPRLKSRLTPESLEFRPYSKQEIASILQNRINLAFSQGVISKEVLEIISSKTFELKDLRSGLFLLRESGLIAESRSKKQIDLECANEAVSKMSSSKKPVVVDTEEKEILNTISDNPEKTVNELFKLYKSEEGKSLRTFQRKLKSLEEANLIKREAVDGKISKISKKDSKLSDF